jgi:hypothetical protein
VDRVKGSSTIDKKGGWSLLKIAGVIVRFPVAGTTNLQVVDQVIVYTLTFALFRGSDPLSPSVRRPVTVKAVFQEPQGGSCQAQRCAGHCSAPNMRMH